jgi:tetratricopeptide (TPR) repeat protein
VSRPIRACFCGGPSLALHADEEGIMRRARLVAIAVVCAAIGTIASGSSATGTQLTVKKLDTEPKEGQDKPGAQKLAALRKAVADAPSERTHRFELVRALIAEGDLSGALTEAQAWRAKDAYDLVVVRIIGDLQMQLGDAAKARRTYSSIVELLPKDPDAHRALATVLKEAGDLDNAFLRLSDASKLRPTDARLSFELADVVHRMGKDAEAAERLQKVVDDKDAQESVKYPAKQRLAQILAARRREAIKASKTAEAAELAKKIEALGIKGGIENDLKVYLSWDTDRTDVDLWVDTPGGQRVWYQNKSSTNGEALYDDVTSGYGPESFTAKKARPGVYTVSVNYFGTSRTVFSDARGEVVVITQEGTANEKKEVFPFRIWKAKQTVTVAKIEVKP